MTHDPDDDGWQEYKDGVATGQLDEDGSPREPGDPPEWYFDHDLTCCMTGVKATAGPHPDCPGSTALMAERTAALVRRLGRTP
jgi:hypothetical protein